MSWPSSSLSLVWSRTSTGGDDLWRIMPATVWVNTGGSPRMNRTRLIEPCFRRWELGAGVWRGVRDEFCIQMKWSSPSREQPRITVQLLWHHLDHHGSIACTRNSLLQAYITSHITVSLTIPVAFSNGSRLIVLSAKQYLEFPLEYWVCGALQCRASFRLGWEKIPDWLGVNMISIVSFDSFSDNIFTVNWSQCSSKAAVEETMKEILGKFQSLILALGFLLRYEFTIAQCTRVRVQTLFGRDQEIGWISPHSW